MSFEDLGLNQKVVAAVKRLDWKAPTDIQSKSIPPIISGRNVFALAETGSGKTGAYALPIIQKLIETTVFYHSLVIVPTRELAIQVQNQFMSLGCEIGLNAILLVGGIPLDEQAKQMRLKSPHVIIATPGRFIDHIKRTNGFDEIKLKTLKFLVIDEADRMMGDDFMNILERILVLLPRDKQTLLFSATMTDKINKLSKAAIRNPIKITTRKSKYQTVSNLKQFIYLVPQIQIDAYLVYLLRYTFSIEIEKLNSVDKDSNLSHLKLSSMGSSAEEEDDENLYNNVIIFTRTRDRSNKLTLLLRQFIPKTIIPLNGDMPQAQRIGALTKFKKSTNAVLVATDIAARGLDVPAVGLVINYDVPLEAKTYMHRVGRTARAGRQGVALTLLTQSSVCFYIDEIETKLLSKDGNTKNRLESLILPESELDRLVEKEVESLQTQVLESSLQCSRDVSRLKKKKTKNALTSFDDAKPIPAGTIDEDKSGTKRTMWASEAGAKKRKEIETVLSSVKCDENFAKNKKENMGKAIKKKKFKK